MSNRLVSIALLALLCLALPLHSRSDRDPAMEPKRLTAILLVDEIELSLPFWEEVLRFRRTIEVPKDSKLVFAAFEAGPCEVMLQTRAEVLEDFPEEAHPDHASASYLFLEVEDLDAYAPGIEPYALGPERLTFYGMRERMLRTPGGHVVTLAQQVEQDGG